MPALPRPMDGLTVLDFSAIVAGPWATRLMADCGARVIKIEAAGEGDLIRFAPPVVDGMSRVYAQFNRGKESVVLDLKAPADLEAARRLMDGADVVVENFRPGVMDRLGLGFAQAAARHPRLIYCSVSGFGQDGPLAGAGAYAPVVHAMSGFDHAQAAARAGEGLGDDGAPGPAGVMIADFVGAAYAFGAVQAALLRRERFGVGAYVDVSLLESMMSLMAIQYQEAQAARPPRSTVFPPFRTLDGYITIPLVTSRNYQALFDLIGRPDAAEEGHLGRPGASAGQRRAIAARLTAWTGSRTGAACVEALRAAGLACGVHAAPAEVLENAHLAARGAFGSLRDAEGAFAVLNPPFRLADTPREAGAFVARLGEHTEAVLASLGRAAPLAIHPDAFLELERPAR
jgi:crotonobetainyl-CoA:carnitine CoA-transferase CaiB-like acyl-CoA transferase